MSGEKMAKAIFHREFNWSRPKSRFSWNVQPSPDPQSKVHDLVDAAVEAGAATRWKPKKSEVPDEKPDAE